MIFSHKSGLKYRAMFPGKSSVSVVVPGGGSPAMGGSTGSGGSSGGSSAGGSVSEKDVNFYDYDGTLLHAYTVAEAQALTELPELPEREGLICQGWNYDLETIKEYNCAVNVGATYTTDDGTTRIYIHLEKYRTSPMLGVCVNGTVTVDWGDGTTPDVLTGTSTLDSKTIWTPNHEYTDPGDYVIKLTVDGEIGFSSQGSEYGTNILRASQNDTIYHSQIYTNAIKKIELGNNIKGINQYAFEKCYYLESIVIPNSVTSIGKNAFLNCRLLSTVIPNSVKSIGVGAFSGCYAMICSIPDSVSSVGSNSFTGCFCGESLTIPRSLSSISSNAFSSTYAVSCTIPKTSSFGNNAFSGNYHMTRMTFSENVSYIGTGTFSNNYACRYYDFSNNTKVPTLSGSGYSGIAADCEIRVPAALYDEWIAATNWTSYADKIVAV